MANNPYANRNAMPVPDYQRMTAQLLLQQQSALAKRQQKSQTRWYLLYFAAAFLVLSKYVMLRTEYKEVFALWHTNDTSGYDCASSNDANPWNIVLNVHYPVFGKFISNPLARPAAIFLWSCIRDGWMPTRDSIDAAQAAPGCTWSTLALSPLAYMCGNILQSWANAAFGGDTSKALAAVKQNPKASPWTFYLDENSSILTKSDDKLEQFCKQGLYGFAIFATSDGGTSASDLYSMLFSHEPPDKGCSNASRFADGASTVATFTMAASAFGPAGSVVGGLFGMGMALTGAGGQCGGSGSGCSIM